jgi:hypothetical protein
MKYPSGKQITLGDPVWWNEGANIGRISLILDKEDELKRWGLEDEGVFVCFDFSGKTNTADAFTPEKDLEREGLDCMTEAETAEICGIFARFRSSHPEAKDSSFTVLFHRARKGIRILELLGGSSGSRQFYAIYEGSMEFLPVSEHEAVGRGGPLNAPPSGGGPMDEQ